MNSGGLLGNSVMNFGLFYYEIEKDKENSTRFKFKELANSNSGNIDG